MSDLREKYETYSDERLDKLSKSSRLSAEKKDIVNDILAERESDSPAPKKTTRRKPRAKAAPAPAPKTRGRRKKVVVDDDDEPAAPKSRRKPKAAAKTKTATKRKPIKDAGKDYEFDVDEKIKFTHKKFGDKKVTGVIVNCHLKPDGRRAYMIKVGDDIISKRETVLLKELG